MKKINYGINWAFVISANLITLGLMIPYTINSIKNDSQMRIGLGLNKTN